MSRARAVKQSPNTATRAECEALEAYLRSVGAIGAAHAVPKQDVLAGYQQSLPARTPSCERVLREIISSAPGYGVPIVSNNSGYYVAATSEDFDACIRDLRSRVAVIAGRAAALETLRDDIRGDRLF